MKICVVGGGSTYTPELVDGILRRGERLPARELVLLDPNEERLEIVGPLGPDASLAPSVRERLRSDNAGLFGKLDG